MSMRHRVWWILSDGQWHSVQEVLTLSQDIILPEKAVRAGIGGTLDEKLTSGSRRVLLASVREMTEVGLVEIAKEEGVNPHGGEPRITSIRLAPGAWSEVLSKPQRLGRILFELRNLMRSGRAEVTVKISPQTGGDFK